MPMQHGKAIAGCMAYQLYKACANGLGDLEWKLNNLMIRPEFLQVVPLSGVQLGFQASEGVTTR